MAAVSTRKIVKKFGEVPAVNGISLEVPNGEFMVLLGPSGCGKTTFLRIICGLEQQTSGDLLIGGDIVNDIPPRARGVAMMFQSYGLYPHFSVRHNIAFPLRTQRVRSAEIDKKVAWASQLLGIDHLLDRRPRQLSGGERQRVALARAIDPMPGLILSSRPPSRARGSHRRIAMRLRESFPLSKPLLGLGDLIEHSDLPGRHVAEGGIHASHAKQHRVGGDDGHRPPPAVRGGEGGDLIQDALHVCRGGAQGDEA